MVHGMKLLLLLPLLCVVYGKLPLEDATATVNQLFTYDIDPKDFIQSPDFEVKEAGKDTLPSWLTFDEEKSELLGVPSVEDKGTYILSVNQEMFAVTVAEPTKYQLAQPTNVHEQTVCKGRDSITVVYVKLNTDTAALLPIEKANLVRSLTAHLSLKPDHVSMSSKPSDLMDTNHALVSGTGDISSTGDSLSALSWIVGCGAVKAHHMDILEKLESTAKDGSMGKLLNTGVSGWQVQSNQPKALSKRRLKRQALVTSTPVPDTTTDMSTTTTEKASTPSPTAVATMTTATTVKTTMKTTKMKTTTTTTMKPANQQPVLNEALLPSSLPAFGGELVRWKIPDELFTDPEGEMLTYSIESMSNTKEWIVLDDTNGGQLELVGVASESLQGTTESLYLTAMDPAGGSTQATIKIEHSQSNKNWMTQIYTLKIRKDATMRSPQGIVYLALTLQDVATFKSILISSVEKSLGRLTVVLGDNMGYQEMCPKAANNRTLNFLRQMVGQDVHLVGLNEQVLHIQSIDSVTPRRPCINSAPMVNTAEFEQYKELTVYLGELYESIVPVDLFTDEEDGDLSKMSMNLLIDGREASNEWISYDPASRRLEALAWEKPGSMPQLSFVVEDSAGSKIEESIHVLIKESPVEPTNQITLSLSTAYSVFVNSHNSQVDLYRKLRNAFSDSVVTVNSVKTGSVILAFSLRKSDQSSSLPTSCDKQQMESYKEVLFDGDVINTDFAKQLDSYSLEKVDFLPLGGCEGVVSPKSGYMAPGATVDPSTGSEKSNIMVIIIIVVVVVVLIIIIVIGVVCVRKRKAEKNKAGRQNGSNIEKRPPVVLDEEMKSLTRSENEPLVPSDMTTKSTPTPPAYPGEDNYQPDTPPVSEPDDERRILNGSP